MDDEIAYLHGHDLREMVKSKKISAVELTQHFLDRIEKYNDEYHAYDWVIQEEALESARQVDQWVAEGNTDLQLLGVPFIIDGGVRLKSTPLSYGCVFEVDEATVSDAIDVTMLKNAGAIILGKGNTSEFGMTATTINSISPETKNPLNPLYSTGGACGGAAAAIAKGLATMAIGPDKNGGMRLPASYCGMTSIKATRGRVPFVRDYVLSIIKKALTQISPMGRCVTDVAMALNVLAYDEENDYERLRVNHGDYETICHEPLPPIRIGWIPQIGELVVDRDVSEICDRSIKLLKSTGFDVDVLEFDIDIDILKHYCNVFSCEHYVPIVGLCEMDKSGASQQLRRGTHRWLNYAKTVTGVSISAGVNNFGLIRDKFDDFLKNYDLIITPSSTMTPLTIEELEEEDITDGCFRYSLKALSYLLLTNLSGHPSMVLPVGVTVDGLPVGFNVISKYCHEDLLLQFANVLEETFEIHGKTSFV